MLREYRSSDCDELIRLFYNTVHTINARDYDPDQLDAWATGSEDAAVWDASFKRHRCFVAVRNGVIVGFGDIDGSYIDRLYVHHDHQGQGIGSAICDRLESLASGSLTTHASITARPFFEKRGYTVVKEQQVERRGVMLTNYVMEKKRTAEDSDEHDIV